MATHHGRTTPADCEPPPQTSLQIELKAADRQAVTTFRDTFLRWLNEGSGPVSHVLGTPDRLSLDEVPAPPDADGLPTLRVNVSWNRDANAPAPDTATLSALPDEAEPPPSEAGTCTGDNFGCFPDEYQDSPMRHIVISPAVSFPAPLRVGGRAREAAPSIAQRVGMHARAAWTAARGIASHVHLPPVTIRVPSPSDVSGMRSFVTLATAAAVIGFMVGTLFLAEVERPERSAAAAARLPASQLAASAAQPIQRLIEAPVHASSTPQPTDAGTSDPVTATGRTASASSGAVGAIGKVASARHAASAPAPARAAAKDRGTKGNDGEDAAVATSGEQAGAAHRAFGTLLVRSQPQGAKVTINGVVRGRTPLLVRDLNPGSRVVRLDLTGYEPWSWAVQVAADKQTPVTVKLQPEARAPSSQQH